VITAIDRVSSKGIRTVQKRDFRNGTLIVSPAVIAERRVSISFSPSLLSSPLGMMKKQRPSQARAGRSIPFGMQFLQQLLWPVLSLC